jgi:oligoribonuclease (3'-5' exoribonuclease)
MVYPQALFWIDVEAPGLPKKDAPNDYSKLPPLEVGVIITDMDLQRISGYEEVIKLNATHVASLKDPDNVGAVEMHKKNGLIKASRDAPVQNTVAFVEKELITLIKETTTYNKGEFMIAGSGVAAYDRPLLNQHMPELASYFAYYPFDIGVERRVSKILAGQAVVNYSPKSYGEEKLHRAYADVEAHLDEALQYREWFRKAIA